MTKANEMFEQALSAEGISGRLADLARSIYSQESGGGKHTQTSNRGAKGGMQITDGAFKEVADKGWSIDDPLQSVRAGIRYLKDRFNQGGGDPALAAAGYYGGPGGLEKARKGIAVSDPVNPSYPNTLQYAASVVGRMGGGSKGNSSEVAPVPAAPVAPYVQTLPDELVAALNPKVPGMTAPSGDSWQQFLSAMPSSRQPVRVNDLDYSNPRPATQLPQFQFNATQPAAVNFASFSTFGKRRV